MVWTEILGRMIAERKRESIPCMTSILSEIQFQSKSVHSFGLTILNEVRINQLTENSAFTAFVRSLFAAGQSSIESLTGEFRRYSKETPNVLPWIK